MKTKTKVERYKGERALEAGMKKMARRGYTVQSHNTRKKAWSLKVGLFTRQQIHTVTYIKTIEPKHKAVVPSTAVAPSVAAGWYPDDQGTTRWWDGYQWTYHTG